MTASSSKATVESLYSKCIKVLAVNFKTHPVYIRKNNDKVTPDLMKSIVNQLQYHSIDESISVSHIEDESYWKHECIKKYGETYCYYVMKEHNDGGLSWKQLFCENLMSKLVENFNCHHETINTLKEFIFALRLNRIPEEFSLLELPNLMSLTLNYRLNVATTEATAMCIGMKEEHGFHKNAHKYIACLNLSSLGEIINHSISLLRLDLSSNQIDDDQILTWIKSMRTEKSKTAPCLTYLNMSHNQITTYGMRILVNHFLLCGNNNQNEFINKGNNGDKFDAMSNEDDLSVLSTLILSDNRIHAEGGRFIERVLRANTSLIKLDLSMNRLEDSGGKMIIKGLSDNASLCDLNLSSNSLGSKCASEICVLLTSEEKDHVNNPLSWLDLSCNLFDQNDINQLVTSLEKKVSPKLLHFDIRSNIGLITYDLKERIDSVICSNRSKNNKGLDVND